MLLDVEDERFIDIVPAFRGTVRDAMAFCELPSTAKKRMTSNRWDKINFDLMSAAPFVYVTRVL
jgi:hypothetical protein